MKMQASETSRQWMYSFMDGCHEMARDYLKPYIDKMFENCHLALLEFADKAESNASEIRFMEAGNIVRENRAFIEQTFFEELASGFTHFKTLTRQKNTLADGNHFGLKRSEAQMSLVSKEETDLEVAIQNMVSGAVLDSSIELTGIRQRLTVLNNGHKLSDEAIPAGPASLALAFDKAGKALLLEHESKLIVYLIFEKFVLRNTNELYAKYNERLLKAGLLQNLKYEARKNPASKPSKRPEKHSSQAPGQSQSNNAQAANSSNQSSASATGQGGGGATGSGSQTSGNASSGDADSDSKNSISDELFGSIMDLMARRSPQTEQRIENAAPQAEIVSAIQTVQESIDTLASAGVTADSPTNSKQSVERMVKNLTAEREQLFRGIDRRRMPAADTQMIDLVGMMFEYMLNDKDIPNVAKAELSRLHTPYLKVAILDKTFFTNNDHTAHRLLNELARAAARWVYEDNTERGIFPCMRKIVSRVLLDFKDNLNIFSEMHEVLNTSLQDLENKAVRIEEHSRQAAEGRDKLELARARAETVISEAVNRFNTPKEIRQMLGDVWHNKLTFIYLRDEAADNSESWELATDTIESILWCTEPRYSDDEKTALQEQFADAHSRIKQSLETLSAYGASNIESDIALIQKYTEAALKAVESGESRVTTDAATVSQDDATDQQREAPISADIDEPLAQAEPGDSAPAEDEPSADCIAAMEQLDDVPFGTWFTLSTDPEQPGIQAKLSWHSHVSGNYMFVDSMGVKAAVLKRRALADMMVSGDAKIMATEQRPLIQRALLKIRRMLGSDKEAQA